MYTQASEYVIFFYDILYLYAKSVRAALDQGTDPRNGSNMFEIATQQSFLGKNEIERTGRSLRLKPFSLKSYYTVSSKQLTWLKLG